MYEIRRYRRKLSDMEFVGIVHASGDVIDIENSEFLGEWYDVSQVEPVPDPTPEFTEARNTLGKLQQLLLDGKIPCRLYASRPPKWKSKMVDNIECWVPPPPSPLRAAIELAEPLAEKMDGPVYLDPVRLKLLVDAARKHLEAEKGGDT